MTAVFDQPASAEPAREAQERRPRRRIRRRAVIGGGIVVALLGLSQVLVPAFAEQKLRSHLDGIGNVSQVQVSAVPAVKLLWSEPDHATVRMSRLDAGPFVLRDVSASQRGHAIDVRATLPRTELPPLPGGLDLNSANLPGGRLLLGAATSSLDLHGKDLRLDTARIRETPQGLVLHATGTLD